MSVTSEPVVKVKDGMLRGTTGKNLDGETFYQFFGIPYAKPPVQELRFKAPQPIDPWSGVRDATKVGSASISRDDITRQLVGSEDCLYINVYTRKLPDTNAAKLRPVMVYIYGGGLVLGSSRPGIYGPEFLMLRDIVLVTFNYRLGVLGFLSIDNPSLGVTGNAGLKDQNLALKWVQRNISSFNGDPNNVTIFGESAGGASVHAHVISASSKGLFHKAIAQSGCTLNSFFWGCKNNAREVVEKMGKSAGSEEEALKILQETNALEIFDAQEKIDDSIYPADRRPFSAVIEVRNKTAFLTNSPIEILKEGSSNHVPLMMGYTQTEGMLLDLDQMVAAQQGFQKPAFKIENIVPYNLNIPLGSDEHKKIEDILSNLYSKSNKKHHDGITDSCFLIGIIEALRLHLRIGKHPTYLYRVSIAGQLNYLKRIMNKLDEPGTCHADELGYLFHSEITPEISSGSEEDNALRTFVQLWTNFAEFGNPTPEEIQNVLWPPVKNEDNLVLMEIGKKLQIKDIPERDRLQVWRNILSQWPMVKFS